MGADTRLPTLFIPHGGGPCFFMDPPPDDPHLWDGMAAYLRGVVGGLPQKPKAILVVSAHWEAEHPTVIVSPRPSLLFDYYGFPEHTYRLTYPAPGAPELAEKVGSLLRDAGLPVAMESARGWDHGVFVPLLLIAPDADTPVLQLSLQEGLDPAEHLALGRALAPLRGEGVLIIGSGMSYHNLPEFFAPRGGRASEAFDAWLTEAVADPDRREAALTGWAQAPGARACHPREEHLLPLMVAAGAAPGEPGARTYAGHIREKAVSGFQFG
jgi:aromatic ring-opening dioxygenase catalytic subunit (LigB family)